MNLTGKKLAQLSGEVKRRLLSELLGERGAYPLSYSQRNLWLLDQIGPAAADLNFPAAYRIRGKIDIPAMERALNALVKRHEAFRITCFLRDGTPWQRVGDADSVWLERINGAGWSEAELRRHVYKSAARPFDLQEGPVFRATLFTISDEDHLLLLAWHHIAFDGWSLSVAISDLGALYGAYAVGREPHLPAAVPYSEFVRWQRGMVHGDGGERHRAYWTARLQDLQPLHLPIQVSRPAAPMDGPRMVRFMLNEGLTERAKELARGEGATLYMVLLAAFFVLLERYCGRDRVLVNAPAAGRAEGRFAHTAGCLVNQIILQADLSPAMTFRHLLAQVKEVALGAFDHQDYPLALVDPDLLRLTGVAFVLHGFRGVEHRLGPLEAEPFDFEWHATTFDLDVQMIESAGVIQGSVTYRPEVLEEAAVHGITRHFHQVLEAAVAEPLQAIARLPLLPPDERNALPAWNATTRVWPDEATLPDLFERQTVQKRDAVAAYCGGQHISYAELDQRANQVAQYLRQLGVGLESVVGIHMPRSLDLLAALLGVLKAGAAYVPIDPSHPPERTCLLLEDCRAAIVLKDLEAARDFPCSPVHRQLTADNLAYVVYTSGSTGAPKGVMGTHAGAVNRCRWMWDAYPFEPGEVCCQRTSLSFVDSVWEIFGPLLGGVPIEIVPDETVKDPGQLALALEASRVSRITVVPSLLNALLEFPLPEGLKYWSVSGEALPLDLARRFKARLPDAILLNLYGCSETAGDSTCWEVPQEIESVAIGHPIANTQIYILDRHGNPLPAGLQGEIAIGGQGLARGYIRPNPRQEERFGAFLAGSSERLYRSGDIGRRLPDGSIEYLSRADQQVKIRGARVELGEVEAILAGDPMVAQAAVRAGMDSCGATCLIACVVFKPGERTDFSALRGRLATRLPDYMIPGHFVALDALPLLSNGKVDRAALPEPELAAPEGAEPRTPVQELLAGIWASVLHVERVGIHNDFFNLGGHSLLAASVMARAREVFQKDLPLRLLFENTTVERLAAAIERAGGPNVAAPPLCAAPAAAQVQLSFGQQRLWFVEQVGARAGAYNIAAAVRLDGPLRVDSVRGAFNEIVRRHRVLRTRVVQLKGELTGLVEERCSVPVAVEETGEAELYSRALQEAGRPFDLERAPLLRSLLLRVAETKHVLVTTVHHMAADGWSMGVLAREFGELYCGRQLPELPVQYSDYVQWQRTYLVGEVLETGLSYWRKHLEAAPELSIGKRERPARAAGRGARTNNTVPLEIASALKALGRRENATLFITLLAAYYVLLAAYSGEQDLVVGCPFANRTHPEVEGLIGFFVNTVLLRANISGALTFRDVLMRARETSLSAYTHQDVPLEKIVEDLRPRRQRDRYPLFNVFLTLQSAPFQPVEIPDLQVKAYPLHTGAAKVDVCLDVLDLPEGLSCSLEYSLDCLVEPAATWLLQKFVEVLTIVAENPAVPLSSLFASIKPAFSRL